MMFDYSLPGKNSVFCDPEIGITNKQDVFLLT